MSSDNTVLPNLNGKLKGRKDVASDDLELGETPIRVKRRLPSAVVVSIRLSSREAGELLAIAEERGTTLSQIAREAISNYLASKPESPPGQSVAAE